MPTVGFSGRSSCAWRTILILPFAFGCTVLLDPGREQCSSTSDCTALGASFVGSVCADALCQPDPKWSCADLSTQPPAQREVLGAMELYDIISQAPLAGVEVSLCPRIDFGCTSPVDTQVSDEAGSVALSVPASFDGYLMMQKAGGIDPTLLFPNLPVTANGFGRIPVGSPGIAAFLGTQLGEAPLDGRGTVLLQLYDCNDDGAAGATLAFEGNMTGSRPYYSFNSLPSPTATVADDSGRTGVINAVPGILGVQVKMNGVTVSQSTVLVREGFVSLASVLPGRSAGTAL